VHGPALHVSPVAVSGAGMDRIGEVFRAALVMDLT
jgi:hypothetical protein